MDTKQTKTKLAEFTKKTKIALNSRVKRLRWSRGSVLAFGTQVRGFASGRSRRIFRAKKNS
jgi:hypothetical protein